jgi:hypothetical protein
MPPLRADHDTIETLVDALAALRLRRAQSMN